MAFTQTLQEDPSAGNYLSDEAIKRKRALADALIQQGSDTSAIRSPWQGVARLAQGLMGGLHQGMADAAERENAAYSSGKLQEILGGSSGASLTPGNAPSSNHDFEGGVTPRAEIPQDLKAVVLNSAKKYGVPENVALAMMQQESSGNPNAPHGGLFQITKGTAAQPGYGVQPVDYNSLSNPANNADFAMNYLSARNKGINWNDPTAVDNALRSYNGGGDPNYVQHVRRYMPQQANAPIQVASNDPTSSAQFLVNRSRNNPANPEQPQAQPQTEPSQANRILAAMSDPRISPEHKQILATMYKQEMDKAERYSQPFVNSQGQTVQYGPHGEYIVRDKPEKSDATKINDQIEQRKQAVISQGLDPNNPRNRDYILTGSMPQEKQQQVSPTDKKAILEADEMVETNQGAINALKQAKELSKQAWGVPGAGIAAKALAPFNENAQHTIDLDNVVTSDALANLKSIFGGNPTEGERAILLQLQGSSSLPDAERQKIYDRAIALANRRLEFNKRRASDIRSGNYYSEGHNPNTSIQANPNAEIEAARQAIANGKDRNAVIQRLREHGINPEGL